jgi:hypothetical protein
LTEHQIRLRGGWELREDSEGPPRRLTLPFTHVPGFARPLQLYRSFQAPSLDPGREQLWLRVESVPGLLEIQLNGRKLPRPDAGAPVEIVRLDKGPDPALAVRNELMFRVDVALVPPEEPWGSVALVIRSS